MTQRTASKQNVRKYKKIIGYILSIETNYLTKMIPNTL